MSERLIPESELKQAVREILSEMLGATVESGREYYPTSKAVALLGYDNHDQLLAAIKAGLLRVGIEVEDRRKPQSQKARYYFHIKKCQERLHRLPEKRKC